MQRTDAEMRDYLNLTLQAAVLYGDADETEIILRYGRKNTMLLQLNQLWIRVALRVSEEDGPAHDGLVLLKTLLSHDIVFKRSSEEIAQAYPEYPTARNHFIPLASRMKSSIMINILKATANMALDSAKNDNDNDDVPDEGANSNTIRKMPISTPVHCRNDLTNRSA